MPDFEFDAAFFEVFEEEEKELRKFLPSGKNYFFTWKTIQESGFEIPPAKLLSTRTQSFIPTEWGEFLDAVLTRSTGYDHVTDFLSRISTDVSAAYLPEYSARAVAEQAMMLWTGLLRNIKSQMASFSSFSRDGLTGREIQGRSIAVLGVGRIGSQIIDIAYGLGMRYCGVDIKPNPELISKYSLEYLSLEDALSCSEIAVCALPLTPVTNAMLNIKTLSLMPDGAFFVNIARGEISPACDMLKLLRNGKLAGIGMDVFDREKELASVLRDGVPVSDIPEELRASVEALMELAEDPRVIFTPHNAFNTLESVERKSRHTAENIESWFRDGVFTTPLSF